MNGACTVKQKFYLNKVVTHIHKSKFKFLRNIIACIMLLMPCRAVAITTKKGLVFKNGSL